MEKVSLLKGFFYSIISASAFGSLIVLVRLGYDCGMNVNTMLIYRFAIGAFVMGAILFLFKPASLRPSLRVLYKSMLVGGVLYTFQAYCFFSSVQYVSPSVSELLLYLYPACVTLLAAFVFKERLDLFKFVYISVILVGFVFVFHDALHSAFKLKGVFFGLMAMAIYSCYLLVVQVLIRNEDAMRFVFYTILFAAIGFFIVFGFPPVPSGYKQISIVLALGIIATVVAIGALFLAIKEIGSSLASVFSSFEPVVTIALSAVVLNIGLKGYQIVGAVLIITGVFLANLYHLLEGRGA